MVPSIEDAVAIIRKHNEQYANRASEVKIEWVDRIPAAYAQWKPETQTIYLNRPDFMYGTDATDLSAVLYHELGHSVRVPIRKEETWPEYFAEERMASLEEIEYWKLLHHRNHNSVTAQEVELVRAKDKGILENELMWSIIMSRV